jgi:hypothetical protein
MDCGVRLMKDDVLTLLRICEDISTRNWRLKTDAHITYLVKYIMRTLPIWKNYRFRE